MSEAIAFSAGLIVMGFLWFWVDYLDFGSAYRRGYRQALKEDFLIMKKMGVLYRHFKGGVYEVICEAKHTETGEEMVVYRNAESGETWARPKEMFYGKRGNVQRFTKIEEAEDDNERLAGEGSL